MTMINRWIRKLNVCMLTAILTITSATICSVKTSATEQMFPSGIEKNHIEEKIDEFVKEHQDTTAGMAVAIFDNTEELLKKYYGYVDVNNSITVTQDSVFEWGSTTKLLVWVSVMQMYEQGKINLDEDVRHYLPEGFLTNLSYDIPITMLHLMNHNAGFQDEYVDLFVTDEDYIDSLAKALQKHEPAQIYEPGTVTAYSNWGVALAGFIVEQVSGMSFSEYVHENIFAPLQMEHSAVFLDLSDNEWVQQKRKELQCYTTERELIPDCFYYITLYPAGMCTSTLDDFEKFAVALLNKDVTLLTKEETWDKMFSPSAFFGGSEIPLNCHGFWVVPFGVLTIGHGGNTAGCSSCLLLDRENAVGAVVMTNQLGEKIYNRDMMQLIFGKFERSNYTEEKDMPTGGYRTARTVRKGPFKMMSLSYGTGDSVTDEEELWIFDDSGKQNKIVFSYGDYVQTSLLVFIMELGLVLLWIVAVVFSVVSLIVRGIMVLLGRGDKKKKLGLWSTIAALLQLAAILVLVLFVNNAIHYSMGDTYLWMCAVLGILAAVMCTMCVYGLVWNNKRDRQLLKVRRRAYNNITAGFLLVTIVNIVYWNLFMFWAG